MKYCTLCRRYVEPTKKFSWAIFLLGLCTAGAISIIYLIYYLFFAKKKFCPICKAKKLTKYSPEDAEAKKLEKQEKKEAKQEKRQEQLEATKKILNKAKDKVVEITKDDEKIG